jgi:hypothetical protein
MPEKNPPAQDKTEMNERFTNSEKTVPPKGWLVPLKIIMLFRVMV